MRIGRIEILYHEKIDHPNFWTKRKIAKMIQRIESTNPKTKIDRIKRLRNLTQNYINYDECSTLQWGLKQQKEWIEKHYKGD